MTPETKSYVYFISTEDEAMVKIGCSNSPEHRLSQLTCWSPYPLKVLAYVPGSPADERAAHSRYLSLHSHREWFRSSPAMLSEIAEIARVGVLPLSLRGRPDEPNLLAQKSSIRATPEWRAKMSEIHTTRCAIIKRERAVIERGLRYARDNHLELSQLNQRLGERIICRRNDGSHYFIGGVKTLEAAEQFFQSVSKAVAA